MVVLGNGKQVRKGDQVLVWRKSYKCWVIKKVVDIDDWPDFMDRCIAKNTKDKENKVAIGKVLCEYVGTDEDWPLKEGVIYTRYLDCQSGRRIAERPSECFTDVNEVSCGKTMPIAPIRAAGNVSRVCGMC